MNKNLPPYRLTRSARRRHIRLRVEAGGQVFVSAPTRVSDTIINNFLESHASWLHTKVEYFKKIPKPTLSRTQEKKLFESYKQQAKIFSEQKLKQWNEHYRLSFKKIAIRNCRSRWGSCSSSGTISFNYKIVFLPEALSDYLVVHELCHIKEPNHSPRFWSLMALTIPDYTEKRRGLREFEKTFKPPLLGV